MKRCMISILIGVPFAFQAMTCLADDTADHATSRPVRVFDANGHVIGDLTGFSAQDGVAFTAGNATAIVPITRMQDASFHFSATDFQWLAVSFGQFTSTDCSGDPIIQAEWGPRAASLLRQGNNVTVYFAVAGPEQVFEARSQLNTDPTECTSFTGPIAVSGYATAARLVITHDHPEPLRIGF
jgi:hypothetical protein